MTDLQTDSPRPETPRPNGHDPGSALSAGGEAPARPGARGAPRSGAMAALGRDLAARERLRAMVEETPMSLRRIAERFSVPAGSLQRYVRAAGWTRPPDAPQAPVPAGEGRFATRRLATGFDDAGAVMARLIRAVDRQLAKVEARLRRRAAEVEEKDARILGNLAKTLSTLMALERDGGAKTTQTEPADSGEFRAELARRIAAWAEEEEEPASPVEGDERDPG